MPKTKLFIPYKQEDKTPGQMLKDSKLYYELMDKRRSVRSFSDKPVPKEIIENIVKTASTAPSGAHKQPWTFCLVSSPEMKKQIRQAAEKEEKETSG